MSIVSRPSVKLGKRTYVHPTANLYGCEIGDDCKIGAFVEIQKGAKIGHRCKISSHSFICEGVTIEDEVFIGHGVMFTNDRYPRACRPDGKLQTDKDWKCIPTVVREGAAVGSGVTILPGAEIGAGSIVGSGAVVTKHIPAHATAVGNPARIL